MKENHCRSRKKRAPLIFLLRKNHSICFYVLVLNCLVVVDFRVHVMIFQQHKLMSSWNISGLDPLKREIKEVALLGIWTANSSSR